MHHNKRGKHASWLITILVIFTLLLAGPSQAISVGITDKTSSEDTTNSLVRYEVTVDLHSDDLIPINLFAIDIINGATTSNCYFNISNSALNTVYTDSADLGKCGEVTITNYTNNAQYGQGYGYGYGFNGTGYENTSFGAVYGYQYVNGYGYNAFTASATSGEIIYEFTISTNTQFLSGTTYTVNAGVSTEDNSETYYSENTLTFTGTKVVVVDPGNGGGSSRSGGASMGTLPAINPPGFETVGDAEKKRIALELGLAEKNFSRIEKQKKVIIENSKMNPRGLQNAINNAPSEIVKEILRDISNKISSKRNEEIQISKKAEIYRITNQFGFKEYKTKITLTIPNKDKEIKIIEIIPKKYAADISNIVFSKQPKIIERDPVVEWTVEAGASQEISYFVPVSIDTQGIEAETLAVIESTPFENSGTITTSTQIKDNTINDNLDGSDDTDKSGIKKYLWIWIVVLVMIVISTGFIVEYEVNENKVSLEEETRIQEYFNYHLKQGRHIMDIKKDFYNLGWTDEELSDKMDFYIEKSNGMKKSANFDEIRNYIEKYFLFYRSHGRPDEEIAKDFYHLGWTKEDLDKFLGNKDK